MRKHALRVLAAFGLLLGSAAASAADLMETFRLALEADPRLGAAEASYQAALTAKPQARSALLPQLAASADYSQNSQDVMSVGSAFAGQIVQSASYSSQGYSLSLSQAVYHKDFFIQLKQADSVIAQAEAQFGAARQELIVRLSAAYFAVLAAQDSLDFAQAEKKAIGQQLRQTQQRFEVGLTAITDVREAQARYDLAVAQEIAAQNQLAISREALAEIIGLIPEQLAPLAQEVPLITPEPENIDRWVEIALQQNLELNAAEAAARLAQQEVDLRRAQHYPTLDLIGTHNYSDSTDYELGSEREDSRLMLQLNIPLYTGGFLTARTREAASLYQQAQENRELQRRVTVSSTRQAYLNVLAGISQVNALKQALRSAQTALQATEAGFEVGTRTAVDVLNSQRELFRARRDYAQARYDYILSTLNLKRAAGTLTAEDITMVNKWLM